MLMLGRRAPPAVERAALLISVGTLSAAAWAVLWFSDGTPFGHAHHHGMGGLAGPQAAMMALFVGGWTMMTVAMMLPTTLPVLSTFHAIAGRRPDRVLLLLLVVLGYLLTWAATGGLVYLGYLLIQELIQSSPWLRENMAAGPPLLLLVAGGFQFTSLKYRCLDKCRSPLSFVIEHWQGREHKWQSLRLGVDHGLFCVGCCWALMLLMFAVGFGSYAWMMVLAVIMAVEKNMPWGKRLSAPLGVVLLAWGATLLYLS